MSQFNIIVDKRVDRGHALTIHELLVALSQVKGTTHTVGDHGEKIRIPMSNGQVLYIGSCEEGNNEWACVETLS